MMGLLGVGFGLTFAVIPGLIVRSVPDSETGSAMGFYQVVRYIGFSLGSALAASVLAHTRRRAAPADRGRLHAGLWLAVGVCVLAAASPGSSPTEPPTRPRPTLAEEDAELASAGLVGVTRD